MAEDFIGSTEKFPKDNEKKLKQEVYRLKSKIKRLVTEISMLKSTLRNKECKERGYSFTLERIEEIKKNIKEFLEIKTEDKDGW